MFIILLLLFFIALGNINPEFQKLEQMLERLHFVLGGCVDEGTQNSDHIVASS